MPTPKLILYAALCATAVMPGCGISPGTARMPEAPAAGQSKESGVTPTGDYEADLSTATYSEKKQEFKTLAAMGGAQLKIKADGSFTLVFQGMMLTIRQNYTFKLSPYLRGNWNLDGDKLNLHRSPSSPWKGMTLNLSTDGKSLGMDDPKEGKWTFTKL